ncbi:peptidoglycan glycosyltransferase FtsI [Enterovibrio norvegicus]|uniref:penicillin-binding transpeptidase domain-containing protein n=1 Tax=Enterovibrio norvegicus TaxID=188144 RepID=UPI000C85FFE0|nr:penicillin-binding transpeptidase domain-containing protein [Enterovibrio norvegicus]MCC4799568.1 peptidoglycan glycosyltransferase FtsI [Enterovibrio norvegicus]PMI31640.1 peptidoglycan glycosyltransferase FtsI [Enterovibrio norvegicus]PMI37230.1 peptidoglycan glycosyltransferase FtsI [Enterovibrio norvegicus]PMN50281.1 peptidoglycan glycosyltransferase FtsI [Enterovibrio norvegicus]TKF16867.1 peptidoglycan glycosyltransferase FtsI [Enterovibrio norvegicus]
MFKGKKKAGNQRAKKQAPTFIKWRFVTVCFCISLAMMALIARAAYIQVIEPDRLRYEGDLRSVRVKAMPSARGMITDRNDESLAVSVPVQAVYADPATIFKNDKLQDKPRWYALADVLGIDRQEMLERIEKNKTKRFIYLQRQVGPAMSSYIKGLKLAGIGMKDESRRFYPAGEVSAHLVGVTGIDGRGLEGIERGYDGWLSGEPGRRTVRKDRYGRVVENISLEEREEGKPLQLSIDQRLQAISYRAIKQAVADYRATSGSLVMVDVRTGEVLAMVNAPSYNPNNRADLKSFKMRNRAITDVFEPGSTIKPLVVLAALENGVADESTVIDTGNGVMSIGGAKVRDVSKAGKANLRKILQKSSNIGVSKLSLSMPVEALLGLYSSVGIGDATGVNLVGESLGLYPSRRRWSDFERATLSFGYGLSITPAQLARAYAVLGGLGVNRPLSILKTEAVVPGKQVASRENTRKVIDMLEAVTQEGGSARRAAVDGYRVGAKTGTAKVAVAGGYGDEYIGYTAGIAPISDPRIALVVVINEPQGDKYYGGQVAAPVFSEVMNSALQILNIAPDAKQPSLQLAHTDRQN